MKVQELLDSKDKWTQGIFARNKNGESVPFDSPDAVKWCLLGAIYKCYILEFYKIITKIRKETETISPTFNDIQSYEKVMEVVKELDI